MARFSIGPREESTVILLSGHCVKMSSDTHAIPVDIHQLMSEKFLFAVDGN